MSIFCFYLAHIIFYIHSNFLVFKFLVFRGGLLQGVKKRARLKVTRLVLTGHGQVQVHHSLIIQGFSQLDLNLQVQNIWLSEQEHLRQFLDAADWFIENQDENGGWPSQVCQCLSIWFFNNKNRNKTKTLVH